MWFTVPLMFENTITDVPLLEILNSITHVFCGIVGCNVPHTTYATDTLSMCNFISAIVFAGKSQ